MKICLILKVTAFEPGSTNSDNPEEDTCHWQSTCYQATLRVNISVREIFINQVFSES